MLTCPICHAPLTLEQTTWRCPDRHAFDRAREGYVDLLPVGHGRSGIRGDPADMVRARRRVLGRGHYDPLARLLRDRVRAHVEATDNAAGRGSDGARTGLPPVIAEAGCGEGFYIGTVAGALPDHARAFGFDVSKQALRLAARAHPRITFAVNDVKHRLCLADGSADALLDVFAPRNAGEFRRVLRPDGLLVVVVPGEAHLAQLRQRLPLLEIQPEKRARTLEQVTPWFEPAWTETLAYDRTLPGEDLADLVRMTPSAFHLDDDALTAARALAGLAVTFSFQVLGLRVAGGS